MINKAAFDLMQDGTIIVNCARDVLVDETAIGEALKSGRVKKYVTDFPNPTTAGMEGAIVLPEYEIYSKAKKILPNKNQTIIVYCGNGIRSKKSQRIMRRMGYTNVYNLYKGTENY